MKKYEMDMCHGPLFKKIVMFSIPLMLTGVLQLLYNMADVVVVGQYAEDSQTSLAAVTSNGALVSLIVNLFMGLAVGAGVAVAQYYGAGRHEDVQEVVHTSMLVSVIFGVVIGVFGFFTSRWMLTLMDTPPDVIDQSELYLKIYFTGLPGMMVYNFGASILRSVGDTRRPLYFLTASGLVNVALNLVFVIVFHWDVEGVATATVIAQYISAVLVVLSLCRADNCCHLSFRKLRIHGSKLWQITKIGLPAGIQGALFSISNVLIQSSVNSFGKLIMAGNGAAATLEGFVYTCMNTIGQAAMTFTGQNVGARQYKRISKICVQCMLLVSIGGFILSVLLLWVFAEPLMYLYTPEADVVAAGTIRLTIFAFTYFLDGAMETMCGMLRGMNCSMTPMITSLLGVCGFRVVWIYTVFAANHSLRGLYLSYPISWTITLAAHTVCYFIVHHRLKERMAAEEAMGDGTLSPAAP